MKQESKVVPIRCQIHETAVVHPEARLGVGVVIGPYAVVEKDVEIGDGTVIGPHAVIGRWTIIGRNNRIGAGAALGGDPQHLGFKGEGCFLRIGDHNVIREYASLSRGTEGGRGETRIGNHTMIMAYAHVGHDCVVGDHVVLVNNVALGGHVVVEDQAIIGGMSGVHQFCRVGKMAMVGAMSKVTKDVLPFTLVDGRPAKAVGLNVVGLRRNGIPREVRNELKKAYRALYRSEWNVSQAIRYIETELVLYPEIQHLLDFLRKAERGICAGRSDRAEPFSGEEKEF